MSRYTVFGGRGFIGSEFVKELNLQGHEVYIPERNDKDIYERNLGTVIYSAGYGNCNKDPYNVLEANVVLLNTLLKNATFERLVYISSTRVYMNQYESREDCDLTVCSNDTRRLFNLTKLTAEELCVRSNRKCLIVRPSNVYGLALNSPLFLPSIIRDSIINKEVNMYVTPNYSKDYIYVGDVVDATIRLLDTNLSHCETINLASGVNVNANSISDLLIKKTGCKVNWLVEKDSEVFEPINVVKINNLIEFKPSFVLNDIEVMIEQFQENIG